MKRTAAILAGLALAACGSEPPPREDADRCAPGEILPFLRREVRSLRREPPSAGRDRMLRAFERQLADARAGRAVPCSRSDNTFTVIRGDGTVERRP